MSALCALASGIIIRDTGMVTFVHAALTRAGYRVIVMLFGFSAVLADAVGNGRFTVLPIVCLDSSAGRALAVVSVDHKGGVGAPGLAPGADAVGVVSRGHLVVVDYLTTVLAHTFFIHIAVGTSPVTSRAFPINPVMGLSVVTAFAFTVLLCIYIFLMMAFAVAF